MRDDQGRFVPGESGNPGGRPHHLTELHDLIAPLLPALVQVLFEIACDPKQAGRTRVSATKELMDRGLGRPPRAAAWTVRQHLPPEYAMRQGWAERYKPQGIEPRPEAPPEPAADPEPAPVVTPAQAGVQAGGDDGADRLDSRLRGNDSFASTPDNTAPAAEPAPAVEAKPQPEPVTTPKYWRPGMDWPPQTQYPNPNWRPPGAPLSAPVPPPPPAPAPVRPAPSGKTPVLRSPFEPPNFLYIHPRPDRKP